MNINNKPLQFHISPSFSFNTLQEAIKMHFPAAEIDFDFSHSNMEFLDMDSNVFEFLASLKKGEVLLNLGEDTFSLRSMGAEPLTGVVTSTINKIATDSGSVVYWYNECLKNKVDQSHAGTLAYFLRSYTSGLSKFKPGTQLSEKELDTLFEKASLVGMEPVKKKLEQCYHRINEITSQIKDLEETKQRIENVAEKRIILYQKLIVLITLIQFITFYYAIFHVDWLGKTILYFTNVIGWDIIEPITYTVQCLTVLFGIRFFMKYGTGRSFETMRQVHRQRIINSNKALKTHYDLVTKQLEELQNDKKLLKSRIDLYLNRRNYHQFFLDVNSSKLQGLL